jgi:hypothetical protein
MAKEVKKVDVDLEVEAVESLNEDVVIPEVNEIERLHEEIAILKQMFAEQKTARRSVDVEVYEVPEKPVDNNEFLNERVPFFAFQDGDKYKDDIVVGINGYNYVIQRGKQVMIPRFVQMAIMDSERQRLEANSHSQGLADKFYSETKMRSLA